MRRLMAAILSVALLVAVPGLAHAAAAGSAKGVKPDASADRSGVIQTLVVGSDVFIGDLVETGPKGQVQILFADNTRLVVGPKSSLKIEDYLIRNDGSAGKLAVDMLGGAFRFSTGDAAKTRYKIDTPTGTIGVRGTQFDVFVEPVTGNTWILHYRGIVTFCTIAGVCEELRAACTLGEITTDAMVLGDTAKITGEERRTLQNQFLYALNQSPLLRDFWFQAASDCLRKPPDVPPPENNGFEHQSADDTSNR